jgi:hypothetical protein
MTLDPSSSPRPPSGASCDPSTLAEPLILESVVVARIRLDHAIGGAGSEPVEFLATVELASGLTIGPVKIVLAEPTRVAIDWPDRLVGSDGAGAAREIRLSPDARQQVAEALVRHLLGTDLESGRR